MSERSKLSDNLRGSHRALDISYNEQAGGLKVLSGMLGVMKRLFAFTVANNALPEPYKPGGVIAIFNPTASVAWVAITENGTAPPLPAAAEPSSIGIKPNDYTILAMPEKATNIACSEATAVAYLLIDDSFIK